MLDFGLFAVKSMKFSLTRFSKIQVDLYTNKCKFSRGSHVLFCPFSHYKKTHSSLLAKNFPQTQGTAKGKKMAVAFANIFMSKVESEILSQSASSPLVWKPYIADIFSPWTIVREDIIQFIE